VAAPLVRLGSLDQSGAHRIEVDVAHEPPQVGVDVDQDGLVAAPKEVADRALLPVDPARVAKRKVLDDLRERGVGHLHDPVDVVAHPTEAMDAMAEPAHALFRQSVEVKAVIVREEDILPAVSAEHHAVGAARHMETRLPGHGGNERHTADDAMMQG
jgi:hypothetical protein